MFDALSKHVESPWALPASFCGNYGQACRVRDLCGRAQPAIGITAALSPLSPESTTEPIGLSIAELLKKAGASVVVS